MKVAEFFLYAEIIASRLRRIESADLLRCESLVPMCDSFCKRIDEVFGYFGWQIRHLLLKEQVVYRQLAQGSHDFIIRPAVAKAAFICKIPRIHSSLGTQWDL